MISTRTPRVQTRGRGSAAARRTVGSGGHHRSREHGCPARPGLRSGGRSLRAGAAGPLGDGPDSLPANSSDRPIAPDDLAGTVAALEQELSPRWVWPDTATVYPGLLAAGVRVGRCHDLRLTEGLLVAHDGHWGEPAGLAAAAARLVPGTEIPPDVPPGPAHAQPTLFEDEPGAGPAVEPGTVLDVLAAQRRRTAEARRGSPGFGLLVAAESVAALAAAEIGAAGLPWRGDVHDELLAEALGPRPTHGRRPAKLQALAEQIAAALGAPSLNPDSQQELLKALRRAGIAARSTRRWELREVEHPVIEPLLRYKELARLHAAHGWAWRDQWVQAGRFHGRVRARRRGLRALGHPRRRRAADPAGRARGSDGRPGLRADRRRRRAAGAAGAGRAVRRPGDGGGDPGGRPLRGDRPAGPRRRDGPGGGQARPALGHVRRRRRLDLGLAALRRRFPAALAMLEDAARTGEDGGSVRSVLGRTCPPRRPAGWTTPRVARPARERARGRFTRNFVVQASASDWANVLLAGCAAGWPADGRSRRSWSSSSTTR